MDGRDNNKISLTLHVLLLMNLLPAFGGAILISTTVAFFASSLALVNYAVLRCSPMRRIRVWLIFYVQCLPSPNWTCFQFYVTKQDRRIYYIVLDIILSSQPYLKSGLYGSMHAEKGCLLGISGARDSCACLVEWKERVIAGADILKLSLMQELLITVSW